MEEQKLKNRGITLIAMVITIIVLLILAGVSLSLVMGETGILKRAETASQKTKIAKYKEQLELTISGEQMNVLTEPQDEVFASIVKTAIEQEYQTSSEGNNSEMWVTFVVMLDDEENEVDNPEQCTKLIVETIDGYEIEVAIYNQQNYAKVEDVGKKETGEDINIQLNKNKIILTTHDINTYTLTPTVTTEMDSYEIKWSSSNPSIVTVNDEGKIKAETAGNAIITAKINGKRERATCQVEVREGNVCEFTAGRIYTDNSHFCSDKTYLDSAYAALVDRDYTKKGWYGALLFGIHESGSAWNELYFTLKFDVNIAFSSNYYGDKLGGSGKKVLFYTQNAEGEFSDVHYELTQLNDTQKYGEHYFPAGNYKLFVPENYVTFDEWDFEIVN